ncbi:probable MFS transporter [Cephalotrichum gorgonifer]|uniref:Probable MFS transporter n=1 Tax=Cephalotrichum gorgonifer TaxID=2041049 RepID=A0AAE8MN61_9PEZI|nr:probable MFS transporter [Cephalotrichum gorgonifer]
MGEQDVQNVGDSKSLAPAESYTQTDKAAAESMDHTPVTLSEEDDVRIRKKTDKTILALLIWVYFLQVLDKAVLGTGAVFGLQEDLKLHGTQYSLIGSIASIAQLGWQPFSAWLIVKVPHRYLMPALVFGWGLAETCMAACNSFGALLACRFLLGLFEAGCMPLFAITTGKWYRRVEQPIRVAMWNSTNGLATIVSSALSYGLGRIESDVLHPWQIIFLFCGLLTVVTAPFVYWKLDNDITEARFLTPEDRLKGVERLKTNKTGVEEHHEFKWSQVWETVLDPKTYLWIILAILPNLGSVLTSVFGPLIIKGFGFNSYQTLLLNMPFGAVQTIVILLGCFAANRMKLKGVILIAFMLPVVVGTGMLYGLGRKESDRPALLAAYYICGFLFAANPLIVVWAVGNTAGDTKKAVTLSLFQAGLSAGGLIGPLLFNADDAPEYLPGIRGVLGVFIAMVGCVIIQLGLLMFLNKQQAKRRVANGKSAVIVDKSMDTKVTMGGKGDSEGGMMDEPSSAADLDLTDRQNDEFVYIY